MKTNSKRILFFDGVCHLCSTLVDFALPHFSEGQIFFAPLQGPTAQSLLLPQDLGLDYVVYYRDGQIHRRSLAIAYLLQDMGGVYKILGFMLRILPGFISDSVYKLVADHRYRLFGRFETCRLPTTQEKKFFLD